jgi:putative Holliday junction resolvase
MVDPSCNNYLKKGKLPPMEVTSQKPEKPRVMALDIGLKRTGVAISDENRILASPYTTIETEQKKIWLQRVAEIVEQEEVGTLIVGLPLNQYGEEGQDAEKIGKYTQLLRDRLTLPVIEWDERFTTAQAERSLITFDVSRKKRKTVIDQLAACIILEAYLDSERFRTSRENEKREEDSFCEERSDEAISKFGQDL